MIRIILSRFKFFTSLLHKVQNKKNIILILGSNGSFLSAINNNYIVSQLYIPINNQENLNLYQYFFNKFKKYNIYLLLDDSITQARHELIPIIQSVVKSHPVEKFIKEHFTRDDIVAYNVYNISAAKGEVWQTIIAYCSITPIISALLNYIFSNSLKLGGIYFLALEFVNVIDNILIQVKKYDHYKSYLQIFFLFTRTCENKIILKHHGNILSINTIPYPSNRGTEYLQGIIEQQVSDYLIKYKSYIHEKDLKVCLITVTTVELKTLLFQSNFASCETLFLTDEQLLNTDFTSNNIINANTGFSDVSLSWLVSKYKKFAAYNPSIKPLMKLNLINAIIFKPLIVIITCLIILISYKKIVNWQNDLNTYNLNKQYYDIAGEYRKLKTKYPTVKNLTNIADLYSLQAFLKIPPPEPFEDIEKFLAGLTPEISLQMIKWELTKPSEDIINAGYVKFYAGLNYIHTQETAREKTLAVKQYVKNLQNFFPKYKLQIINSSNINPVIPKITPLNVYFTKFMQ